MGGKVGGRRGLKRRGKSGGMDFSRRGDVSNGEDVRLARNASMLVTTIWREREQRKQLMKTKML
eukprot:CAMPEP_0206571354 /NCGR_PEP_ID=MMETSP0325_2-20121206/27592_1 /ASSEMBLY_ACC=CAM_ASM_000347 /TAXON_ID=2866 /ORGANISM="Crypthecodinium cohnii, Strain Seligo" /LENGTH=63 /DNA_ID=CAMNT_0054075335 /DNA_START=150 /DNA_END=338 /DNA_ORIENTATION=-